MLVCEWHPDVPSGTPAEALSVMRAWWAEKFARRRVVYRVPDERRG